MIEIIKINNKNYKQAVKKAADFIKQGKVMVFPTDTVYGLICDARNEQAVDRIFKIKKRPKGKPISIFINDIKMVKDFCYINKDQEKFLKRVWPRAVTAVLRPKKIVSRNIYQGKKTIGVRIPKYKFINLLILKTGAPIAETSANISGEPATTKIGDILKSFEGKRYCPDLVVSAGNLPKNKPSTVIDLTVKPYKTLRK